MSAVLPWIPWTTEQSKEAAVGSGDSISADAVVLKCWKQRENELKAIRRYRDDWDGMSATAPSPHLVDNAIRFLSYLKRSGEERAPDAVAASPVGSIVLIWDSKDLYVEAEIAAVGIVEWMYESRSGTTHEQKAWSDTNERPAARQGVVWSRSHLILGEPA